jgi:CHASE1-domain containing sensor protein
MIIQVKRFFAAMADSQLVPWLISVVVLLVGLGVTTNLWRHASQQQANGLRSEFEFAADQARNNIRARIDAYEMVMRGGQRIFRWI